MRKTKLHSRAQVFKKYGSKINVKSISLKILPGHKRTGKFMINPPDPLETVYHRLRSNSPLNK